MIEDRRAFLRWSVVATTTSTAMIVMYYAGLFNEIWMKDSSYLSAITAVFFVVMSIIMGHATWKASSLPNIQWTSDSRNRIQIRNDLNRLLEREEVGWFCSEMCLVLGMLGTIIGFVMMLKGFETIDLKEVSSVQGLLGDLGKSMGTALYTTLVGLACGSILKIQCFNLGLEVRTKLGKEE